jgi:Uma2 family endonuclease
MDTTTLLPPDPVQTPPPGRPPAPHAALSPPSPPPPRDYRMRFTGEQFLRMAADGYFDGKRVELIAGEILEMPARGNKHYATISRVFRTLDALFPSGSGYWTRCQATLDLSPRGTPDPDVAVVPGDETRPGEKNPTEAVLIVEVSDSRLAYDRTTKAGLYAAAGVPEYWIVNVPDRVLEVRRDPRPDAAAEFGAGYGSLATLAPGATVAPLARPDAPVPVERLFVA